MPRQGIRVVSLVPSITETLLDWGIEPVACTRFCEQPRLRHVGGTKDPDVAAIAALGPDVVIVDREENRREDADALRDRGCQVHVTHVVSHEDVTRTLRLLAERVGVEPPAAPEPVIGPPPGRSPDRRAFVPIWRRPWMTINAATYGSSLLAVCGIGNVFAAHDERYPTVTLDDAARAEPTLVVLPSEPYPFTERHVPELRAVAPDVQLVDGRDLFWWGVRTPAALDRLSRLLRTP